MSWKIEVENRHGDRTSIEFTGTPQHLSEFRRTLPEVYNGVSGQIFTIVHEPQPRLDFPRYENPPILPPSTPSTPSWNSLPPSSLTPLLPPSSSSSPYLSSSESSSYSLPGGAIDVNAHTALTQLQQQQAIAPKAKAQTLLARSLKNKKTLKTLTGAGYFTILWFLASGLGLRPVLLSIPLISDLVKFTDPINPILQIQKNAAKPPAPAPAKPPATKPKKTN